MKQQVNIKKLDDRAIIPTYGTAFSAGADLYACMDHAVTIAPGSCGRHYHSDRFCTC